MRFTARVFRRRLGHKGKSHKSKSHKGKSPKGKSPKGKSRKGKGTRRVKRQRGGGDTFSRTISPFADRVPNIDLDDKPEA